MPITDGQAGDMLPPELNNPENRGALVYASRIAGDESARCACRGLISLHEVDPGLITPEIRRALSLSGINADEVGRVLAIVAQANRGLITTNNIDRLRDMQGFLRGARGDCFQELFLADEDHTLITQHNFEILTILIDDGGFSRLALASPRLARRLNQLRLEGNLNQETFDETVRPLLDYHAHRFRVPRPEFLAREHVPEIPEPDALRPAPLRHIPREAMPRLEPELENERQQALDTLGVNTSEPRVNCLLDPVTLAAIAHPRQLTGDPTGQYFEYHTLEVLLKEGGGTILHPITREFYTEAQIIDASAKYEELFDKTVAEIRAARPGSP
ncbi:MAG: hypothetical protein KBD64_05620 [Gammaproteobacteria bacterium]|nr:hypothetical protein [Gammaproteobacteria bacterium]MBP9722620.1 hypothetical protein [Gammaproteobacteria bacterium]